MKNQIENNQEKFKELAQELFGQWNKRLIEAINRENGEVYPEEVAEMYLESESEGGLQGELFGTVSNRIRKGREEIAGYFAHFLKSNPSGRITKLQKLVPMDDNTFLMGGEYVFELDDSNDERQEVLADFTFVWKKDSNGVWKILHHHSAKIKEENKEGNKPVDKWMKLKDIKILDRGIDQKIAQGFVLKTFFYEDDNNEKKRATFLLEVKGGESDGENKISRESKIVNVVYRQISDKPNSSSGV